MSQYTSEQSRRPDQLLEEYLNCQRFKPLMKVNNMGDGSFFLRMNIEPFPTLSSIVAEQDLLRIMEKVSSFVYGNNTSSTATMSSSSGASHDQTVEVITLPPTTPTRGYLRCTTTPPRTRTPTRKYPEGFSSARSPVGAKSKRHSNERPSCGEIALTIDESELGTNSKSVSPSLLSKLNSLIETPNKDTSNPEESVSVEINLVKPVTKTEVTCTWPANMGNSSTFHGDAAVDSYQTMVAYRTWKRNQLRGDPVKSIPYVACKGIRVNGPYRPYTIPLTTQASAGQCYGAIPVTMTAPGQFYRSEPTTRTSAAQFSGEDVSK
ncbi:hypothetical protein KIN20_018815 [Parelaphostrongylus tenuis]|uniref:Uncharacterized protein n=1 Tax=Parelaphostrongylus tenuis TaxID=148309 RepID=A0AAD5N2G9_PARTN|nr:hypothetical protein KIN20_018815 [Parelaphostrongylus tenuis]